MDTEVGGRVAAAAAATAKLHPLVQRNTSDLRQQSYGTELSGEEFFLQEGGVEGEKVLPAVAYLEMARAAIEQAWPVRRGSVVLELREVVWAEPVVVRQSKQISIGLWATDEEEIEYEIYSGQGEER